MELEEKLPLSDITNIIQPSVIVRDIQRNQIENAHYIDEITNFSNVNLSLSVTHGKSTRSSCNSVHQLTSDIDNIYASELYAHLRDIEVLLNNNLVKFWTIFIIYNIYRNYIVLNLSI